MGPLDDGSVMFRYYFNLVNGTQTILDPEGYRSRRAILYSPYHSLRWQTRSHNRLMGRS